MALALDMKAISLARSLLPGWTKAAGLAQEQPDLASFNDTLNRMAGPCGYILIQCSRSWPQVLAVSA